MKITTTLTITKQEKNIIYDALQVYQDYLNKMLPDSPQGGCRTLIDKTLTNTNELINELEQSI
jgi:hypothetical protein